MTNQWISSSYTKRKVNELYHLIPSDFDWEFYIEAHKDLQIAGIKDEQAAMEHYVLFGAAEHRISARQDYYLDDIINLPDQQDSAIVIFIQWYEADEETKSNMVYCLKKNIGNEHIKAIHILEENCLDFMDYLSKDEMLKIRYSNVNSRVSYRQWLDYSIQRYPEDIKVLINSDIYLDHKISILKKLLWRFDILYASSRIDQTKSGDLIESRETFEENSPPINPLYSQDCWIFRDKLIDFDADYYLGYENCDRKLRESLVSSGGKLVNLYKLINCIHVDYRAKKNRNRYEL
jgi:hypothetical protein